jgi:hypothetical protein
VTVTITGPTGGGITRTIKASNSESIPIPVKHKVRVAYVGGAGCRCWVEWHELSHR